MNKALEIIKESRKKIALGALNFEYVLKSYDQIEEAIKEDEIPGKLVCTKCDLEEPIDGEVVLSNCQGCECKKKDQ